MLGPLSHNSVINSSSWVPLRPNGEETVADQEECAVVKERVVESEDPGSLALRYTSRCQVFVLSPHWLQGGIF